MPKNARSRDPFFMFKALIIGAGLGFLTVMFLPYFAPAHEVPGWLLSLRQNFISKPEPGRSRTVESQPGQEAKPPARLAPKSGKQSSDIPVGEKPQAEKPAVSEDEKAADQSSASADEKEAGSGGAEVVPAEKADATKPDTEVVLVPAVNLAFPKTFSNEDMSAALKPLLSYKLSDADAAALKDVLAAAAKGQTDAARTAMQKLSDPAARKFAEWQLLRMLSLSTREVRAFRAANPLFPAPLPDSSSETSLFLSDASSADVLKVFANRNPRTGAGKASLGAALLETGERERGLALIKQAWSRHDFDDAVEARFLKRFSDVLDEGDHGRRKLWLAARARKASAKPEKDEKTKVTWVGLKGVAKLRAKRGKGKPLHVKDKKQAAKSAAKKERASKLKKRGARGAKALRERGGRASQRRAIKKRSKGASLLRDYWNTAGKVAPFAVATFVHTVSAKKEVPAGGTETSVKKDAPKTETPAAPAAKSEAGRKPGGETAPKDNAKPEDKDKAKLDGKAKTAGKPKPEEKKQTAQQKAAAEALKLSKETALDSANLLNRLKVLRKLEKDERVWSILRSLKTESPDILDPEKWWEFRRAEVRRALNIGYPSTAYTIASTHGPLDGESLSEAEFLAGWIALRFLKKPEIAEKHFAAAKTVRGFVRDEARAAYWLGMTKVELGQGVKAKTFLTEAAQHPYVYYGQLAKHFLDGTSEQTCEFRAPTRPSEADIAAFLKEDAFKAVMIIKQLDLTPLATSFILDLARQTTEPAQMTLLLEFAERTAPPHVAVRAAKIALLRGFAVEAYAFPTLLPKYDPLNDSGTLEAAVLNALTRQESEFHSSATSPVGAKGLMQLMPGTAKLVATSNKMKYEPARLTSDPSYNVTLGSAYLASMLSNFDGSYILSLAAYNAGPGRVSGWVRDFGDPRRASVDPVDWVERIPFTETRNYVQRVLESVQLYRCRFESGKVPFQIMKDLHRGRSGKVPDLASLGEAAAEKKQ